MTSFLMHTIMCVEKLLGCVTEPFSGKFLLSA